MNNLTDNQLKVSTEARAHLNLAKKLKEIDIIRSEVAHIVETERLNHRGVGDYLDLLIALDAEAKKLIDGYIDLCKTSSV
jgi:hypothetical protein